MKITRDDIIEVMMESDISQDEAERRLSRLPGAELHDGSELGAAPRWGAWVRGEWDAEEPACVKCHRTMSLREGCEWNDFPELNLCDYCTRIVLEEMRPI